MANSVDPDQMLHCAAFDLNLHCMKRPICANTLGYYGIKLPYCALKVFKINCTIIVLSAEKVRYGELTTLDMTLMG